MSETINKVREDLQLRGWSHIDTKIDVEAVDTIDLALSSLGDIITSNRRKAPEFTSIVPTDHQKSLAFSTETMEFHTDNTYLPEPCRTVALFCIKQAKEGGENEIVNGLEVVESLPGDIKMQLKQDIWQWVDPMTKRSTVPRAVIDKNNTVRWWKENLRVGADLLEVASIFDEALSSSPRRKNILLKPGELLVVDNTVILHKRVAFSGDRLFKRARYW